MTNQVFSKFTNKYPLSKTLKFELIPQGETLLNIKNKGLLEKDEERDVKYKLAKKIIDEYHKDFINKALEGLKLSGLDRYFNLYKIAKKDEAQKKEFIESQNKLRKEIALRFSKHPTQDIQKKYNNIFSKELIKVDLIDFLKSDEEISIIKEFENFTTYFKGFNENRENMYSSEEKSTAIGFRLIHQNLPKFIDNMGIFEKLKHSQVKDYFPDILKDLVSVLKVNSIEEIFELNNFSDTLTQVGIDRYNYLLGGYTLDDGKTKIKGLNEYINLFNQKQMDKNKKIAKFKPLFKQILSDKTNLSFLPEEFTSDLELLESIDHIYQEIKSILIPISNNQNNTLPGLIKQLPELDLSIIYLNNDAGLTDISQSMFGNWNLIQQALFSDYDIKYKGKRNRDSDIYEEERTKYFKHFDSFSIEYLNNCLLLVNTNFNKNIANHFYLLGEQSEGKKESLVSQIEEAYVAVEETLKFHDKNNNLLQDQNRIDKIKAFLDSLKALQSFIKPLLGNGKEPDKDERFYSELDFYWQILDQITGLYNKVRNYLTRKPYSTEKIKLNFENSTLLDGWDVNKEEANTSILFVKKGIYYLGVMDKKHNKVFRVISKPSSTSYYAKINYKLLPGASKMLPKVFFSEKNIKHFAPSEEILRIRNHGTHTKTGQPQEGYQKLDFNVNDCRKLIDFFKSSIIKHDEWATYGFIFKETSLYESIDQFYREVENQGYAISYTNIDEGYINTLVAEGKLYLFKIYNKDFSPNSKGLPNMHTLYWKMLFDESNLKNVIYKLNGQAEIFYRKGSIQPENTIIHKQKHPILNKNLNNSKKKSTFNYDIIKDKRYTVDKFQFHVPITLNFKSKDIGSINNDVNLEIQNNSISHIIGIDRGERHLLYIAVIDINGSIKEQFSLNEIVNEYNGNNYITNYRELLDKREGGREEARKNWKTIETIKELKEGYLSQVIHKITTLMFKYNAIVVLEDLNMGFMRGRQKVEKQVYQKFEKMLIDKLNYYVDKTKSKSELGGTLNALQLTNKFESFQKLGKQSGFLFYIPAWNTSKMDPVTGFVNLFHIKYESVDKAKAFFAQFHSIRFNAEKLFFEFKFNYSNFTNKADGTRLEWTLCTFGNRIKTFRNSAQNNQWFSEQINLSDGFLELFKKFKIDFLTNDLKSIIGTQSDKVFFEELINLFNLTLQIRNSITNSNVDYLISPVMNANGDFYFSETADSSLPQNADANGAFNIARKGLWVIEQIKQTIDVRKIKLAMTNKEWLAFAQSK